MPARYSEDLLWRVIGLWYIQGYTQAEVCDTLAVHRNTVGKVIKRFLNGQPLESSDGLPRGRQRALQLSDLHALQQLVASDEVAYLDELRERLYAMTSKFLSLPTICRGLAHLQLTRKQLHTRSREACERKRTLFISRCLHHKWWMFMWTDESAVDGRTHERSYGRAPRGERTSWRSLFLRGQRYSLLPVMSAAGLLDWKIYEDSVNTERFLEFTLPLMSPYPGDHCVVVLDNCRIHHSDEFKELVENAGGYTLYTAPYTPKHNPIEYVFGKIKAWLQRNCEWVETVAPVVAINEACHSITPADCQAYIEHACKEDGEFYLQH